MTDIVQYKSPKLVCYHEAGHAISALHVGARVVEMELYLSPPPAHGRTRIERDEAQRRIIALGGFAIERRLWEESRLVWSDNRRPTEKEMLEESANNAEIDRISYFGSDQCTESGKWPHQLDLEFMTAARDLGKRLDINSIERLASALLVEHRLDEAKIREIVLRDLQ